jgi:TonB family protein
MVRVRLSNTLLLLNRKDEAAAVAKSALDGTDDVEILNDAGYALAETGLDLSYAEEVSRKGITALEAKTAAISPAEVNSNAFAKSRLLIASWDTLGWILFREGKLKEAEPLIIAGWRNALVPESGDHLGQVYEAMGRKEEALAAYRLAAASIEGENASPDVREHITGSIARLAGASAAGPHFDGAGALQESRSYKIDRPDGVSGWGTFRLQIKTEGVIASQQISGDEKLAAIAASFNAMKFPGLVPPGSAAHLLRSAVVSCSMGSHCDVVLVPNSSLQAEQEGGAAQVDHDLSSNSSPSPAQKPQPDALGRYHVGDGVTPPSIVHSENPDFSKEPRYKKIEGVTAVSLTVDAQGDPQEVHVSRSLADNVPKDQRAEAIALDQKAIEAVKKYQFSPAMFNGKPVPVAVIVEVHFRID